MDVWLVACGLSFPRNLSPPFVIGEREARADAVHVYGVSSAIPPSAAIFPLLCHSERREESGFPVARA